MSSATSARNAKLLFHLDGAGRRVAVSGVGPASLVRELRIGQMMVERRLSPDPAALADPTSKLNPCCQRVRSYSPSRAEPARRAFASTSVPARELLQDWLLRCIQDHLAADRFRRLRQHICEALSNEVLGGIIRGQHGIPAVKHAD